jgi:hypothetical protein
MDIGERGRVHCSTDPRWDTLLTDYCENGNEHLDSFRAGNVLTTGR